ncbi:vesicular glutamate transporter 1-like [Phlebotomus argentipes]|uniref:vesicular glutamate transporter 1-like n=1 Tax=Phlebotomus argentipes TaxID=94469 RepID=UPI002892A697|nr:vesicular glutamate transporter 1-like [Phlebotomus argentipes]
MAGDADKTVEISQAERLEDAKIPFWKKRRYHVVIMAFFGLFNLYTLRFNLSVAIVAMTEKHNVTLDDGTIVEQQDFDWDSKQQGFILSSFFYGYIATQLIGGVLGSRFGGHLIFGIGLIISAVLALLIPIAAKTHLALFLTARILQGFFGGIVFPSILAIWSEWAPIYERSLMGNIAYTGNYVGAIAAMLLSGVLSVAWGWESIFYVFGTIGCIWYVLWIFLVKSNPEVDPFITEAEKRYILSSIGDRSKGRTIKHPWKDIFTSSAVWAVVAANFTAMWGFYTLLTQLPMFLNDTLDFNLDTTGIMAAIPYIAMVGLLFLSGYLADWLQIKGYLRTGQVRRYFNCGAFIAQMAFMLLTAFITNPTLSIVFITLGVGAGAFPWSGYVVNGLDLAPSHASVIIGLSNTFGTLSGILSPIVMGYIVTDKSRSQWQIVFYITAAIYLFGSVFCWFFVRGRLQPWAKIDREELAAKHAKYDSDKTTETIEKMHIEASAAKQLEDSELKIWKKRRYHVVFMIFLGLFILLNLRINLSVAIVAMTQKTNVTLDDGSTIEHQEFDWDSKTQGYILSSFFYGYVVSQFLGGFLASRFGGHLIFGLTLAMTAALALLTPIAVKTHLSLFFIVRILQGFAGGGTFPAIIAIWAEWAPVYERSFMGNISYTGNYVGTIAAMLFSGLISVALGWETNPQVDPFINEIEKEYILLSCSGNRKKDQKIRHPVKDILTSGPVLAIVVANFTALWGSSVLLTQLPTFLNDTLDFNLDTTGILSAIPYVVLVCVLFVSGYLADWLQVKGYLRTGQVRRYFTCGSFLVQTITMLLTAFTTTPILSVVYISIGVGASALTWSGYFVNALDIAPSHAAFITGISRTIGTLSGIISPILTGYIVTEKSREQWQIIFYLTAGIFLTGTLVYWFFMSGTIQPWAKLDLKELEKSTNLSTNDERKPSQI